MQVILNRHDIQPLPTPRTFQHPIVLQTTLFSLCKINEQASACDLHIVQHNRVGARNSRVFIRWLRSFGRVLNGASQLVLLSILGERKYFGLAVAAGHG